MSFSLFANAGLTLTLDLWWLKSEVVKREREKRERETERERERWKEREREEREREEREIGREGGR